MRAAAAVARGKHIAENVKLAIVVPGLRFGKATGPSGKGWTRYLSRRVSSGVNRVVRCAWRMNDDRLSPGERCASTSNRNFEGRQGPPGGRTHLVSPEMAAAAAIAGHFVDVRGWL